MSDLIFKPQKGAQERFLSTKADIAVYGGSAGSGKSYALLLGALRHVHVEGYGAVIFRRENKELTMEGGLVPKALSIYPHFEAIYRSQPYHHFIFPNGNKISFGHLNQECEVLAWQGSEICHLGFDEGNHFTDYQFTYMMSRNRSTCGVRPHIRMTCNPDSESWLAEFLSWWIDQNTGFPIKERGGMLRYLIRVNGERVWGDSPQELVDLYGCDLQDPKSVTFIPAVITDNPILMERDPGYIANLKGMNFVERSRLLEGNWKVRQKLGTCFPRYDTTIIDWMPSSCNDEFIQWIRSWDFAASEEQDGHDVDWTVGMLLGRKKDGTILIGDVIRVRRRSADVRELVHRTALMDGKDVWISIPQDPGQSGKFQISEYKKQLTGFYILTRAITKNKLVMARPAMDLWQRGVICLVRAKWNEELLNELELFPEGKHDDQVDALSAGVQRLPGSSQADYKQAGLSGKFRHKESRSVRL